MKLHIEINMDSEPFADLGAGDQVEIILKEIAAWCKNRPRDKFAGKTMGRDIDGKRVALLFVDGF